MLSGNPEDGQTSEMTPLEFINDTGSDGKIILSMTLPVMTPDDHVMAYKVCPRAHNTHTYVSAGFWFKINEEGQVSGQPSIVYTGLSDTFVRLVFIINLSYNHIFLVHKYVKWFIITL